MNRSNCVLSSGVWSETTSPQTPATPVGRHINPGTRIIHKKYSPTGRLQRSESKRILRQFPGQSDCLTNRTSAGIRRAVRSNPQEETLIPASMQSGGALDVSMSQWACRRAGSMV